MSWLWNRQRATLMRAEELLTRSEQEYAHGHLDQAHVLLDEIFGLLSDQPKLKAIAVLDRAHQLNLQLISTSDPDSPAVVAALRSYRDWSRAQNLGISATLTIELAAIHDAHHDHDQALAELEDEYHRWDLHDSQAPQAVHLRQELADRYWQLGRREDAVSMWQRSFDHTNPESPLADILSDALIQCDQPDQAVIVKSCIDTARYLSHTDALLQHPHTTMRQRLLQAAVLSRTDDSRHGLDLLRELEQELRHSPDIDAWVLSLCCVAEAESLCGLTEQSCVHGEQAYRAAIRLWDITSQAGLSAAFSYAEILDQADQSTAALDLRRTIRIHAGTALAQLPDGAAQLRQLDKELHAAGMRITESTAQPRMTTFAPERRYRLVRALRDHRSAEALREAMFLAEAASRAGHLDIAVSAYTDACEVAADEELFGPLPLIEATNGLAMATEASGKNGAAIELYEANLAQAERTVGHDHPMVRVLRANLADTLENVGRVDDAAWLWSRNVVAPREGLAPVAVGDTVRLGWLALRTARPQVALRLAFRAFGEARATGTTELILSAAALLSNVAQEPELNAQHETVTLLNEILTPELTVAEATLPLLVHVLNVAAELAVETEQCEIALPWLAQASALITDQPGLLRQFGPRLAEAYLDCDAVGEAMELLEPLITRPELGTASAPLHNEQARQAWDRAVSLSGHDDPYPALSISEPIPDSVRIQRNFFLAQEAQLAAAEHTAEPELAIRAYEHLAHQASHAGLPAGDFLFGLLPVRIATVYERQGQWNQALDTIMTALDQAESQGQWTSVAGVMLTARALWQLRYLGQFDDWCALVLRDAKNTTAEQGKDSS
ncbi:MAG: tetratricopeptide repeat protein, partial [Propionibacteriaceae bacterium]